MCVIVIIKPLRPPPHIRRRLELVVLIPLRLFEIRNRRGQNLVDLVAINNQPLALLFLDARDLTDFLSVTPEIA